MVPKQLTQAQLTLAQEFVATRNAGLAYRRAYDPPAHLSGAELWARARAALNNHHVQEYVSELTSQALTNVLISAQDIIQDWVDIVHADPNEIVAHVRVNCRFCHGIDHQFQWIETEYYTAAANAIDLKQEPPDCSGGFGYNGTLEPVGDCPSCFGMGIGEVRVADTTKLSPGARKLLKGIEVTKNGIKVMLHDQQEARNMIATCMGILGATAPALPFMKSAQTVEEDKVVENVTPEQAAKEYLRLVSK